MHLIQTIEQHWQDFGRRELMLKAYGRQWEERSAFPVHENILRQNPVQAWGECAWRVLADAATPQRAPLALLIDAVDESLVKVVVQSALGWFADRGQAVLIHCPLLAALAKPLFHEMPGTPAIEQLAALLLGEALALRTHVIVCLPAKEHGAWNGVVSTCSQQGYRIVGIEHEFTKLAHRSSLREAMASKENAELHRIHDSTTSPTRTGSPQAQPATHGGRRKVALGDFSAVASPAGIVDADHKPCPANADLIQQGSAPSPRRVTPSVPIAADSTPSKLSEALVEQSSSQQVIDSDANLQRRRAFQQNIFDKAHGHN